jgi:hypothetical protein
MSDLGQARLTAHTAAGLMLSWVKASEGHRLDQWGQIRTSGVRYN